MVPGWLASHRSSMFGTAPFVTAAIIIGLCVTRASDAASHLFTGMACYQQDWQHPVTDSSDALSALSPLSCYRSAPHQCVKKMLQWTTYTESIWAPRHDAICYIQNTRRLCFACFLEFLAGQFRRNVEHIPPAVIEGSIAACISQSTYALG